MTGYQVLKLMSGDDVICNVVSDVENKLKISDPLNGYNHIQMKISFI